MTIPTQFIGYGIGGSQQCPPSTPYYAEFDPGSNSTEFPIGKIWINKRSGSRFVLTSTFHGNAVWRPYALTDTWNGINANTGSLVPISNTVEFTGPNFIFTVGANSNSITLQPNPTNIFIQTVTANKINPASISTTLSAFGKTPVITAGGFLVVSTAACNVTSFVFISPAAQLTSVLDGSFTITANEPNATSTSYFYWIIN